MPRERPIVLVVEADDEGRSALVRRLSANGFGVVDAAAAEDALYECGRHVVDLVLAALDLPGLSGADLCRLLRARGGPPVVLMADAPGAGVRASLLDDGAEACVDRDRGPGPVVAHVGAVLRRRARP